MAVKKPAPKQDALLSQALDLHPKEISQLSIDPVGARRPIIKTLALIKKHRPQLKKQYPGFDLNAFDALLELADRTAANQRIVQRATGSGSLKELLPPATIWRRQLLLIAQGLALSGKVDRREVAAIENGVGATDTLRDVGDLVKVLTPFKAQVESLYGAGALSHAADAANAGLAAVGSGEADPESVAEARDLRDRYGTLMVRGYDRLKAAVAALFGYREVENLVPPLATGTKPSKTPKDEPPTPEK